LIIAQASNRILESKEQIQKFWLTRNFDAIINESKSNPVITSSVKLHESNNNQIDPLVAVMHKLN
jgi:hypothetical protein